MTKLINFGITSIFVIILSAFTAYGSVPLLLKGTVTDEISGKPLGVTIVFMDDQGKKIKIQSNSIAGNFEQVLNSSSEYSVILSSNDIVRKELVINTKDTDSYTEQKIDFKVKKLAPGVELYSIKCFEMNDDKVNGYAESTFNDLMDMMKFNRSVKVDFKVNAYDLIPEKQAAPEPVKKKSKKKSKAPVIEAPKGPDAAEVKQLVDSRVNALKTLLEDNEWKRYIKRINVKPDYSIDLDSGPKENNLSIVVVSTEDIFD